MWRWREEFILISFMNFSLSIAKLSFRRWSPLLVSTRFPNILSSSVPKSSQLSSLRCYRGCRPLTSQFQFGKSRPTAQKISPNVAYLSDKTDQSDKNSKAEERSVKDDDDNKQLSLYQRFKKMWRQYWYVLIPVHLVTSVGWIGSFYYLSVRLALRNDKEVLMRTWEIYFKGRTKE